MDRPNTQMAMFTLAQKVFTVKAYYQNRESSSVAMESLTRRYGIRNTTDNRTIVSRIILTFEKTGSILNRFYYNTGGSPEPQKRRIPPRAKKPEPQSDAEESPARQRQLQVMELSEDDLIVEVFSEMDAETRSVNVEEEEQQHDDEPVDGEDLVHEDDIIEMDESSLIAAARDVETAAHCSTRPDPSQDVVLAVVPDRAVRPKVFRDMLCPECGKTMPSSKMKSHLQQHHQETKSDEPPKKFKCDVCPAEFTTRSNVFTHRRKHFPHMQFVCEICAKVSTNNAIHKNHMLMHSNERPHQCPDCPLKFSRKQGLRRHRMTHTGEKPLVCTVCGAAFLAHMTLNMHMRLHTGERPFACEHCNQRFIGKPSLNSHLKKHHPEEYMYECGMCSGRFKSEKWLRDHMEKKHGLEKDSKELIKVERVG